MTLRAPGTSAGRLTTTLSVAAILVIYALQTHMAPREMLLPPMRGDQAAYLEYAKQMRLSGYAFEGDRNRMPLYPFLLSLIYRNGMNDAQFLEKARTFNINLTIVLLLGLFLIFRKFFPPFYSVALLATAAFGLYIYRARVVHVEPLFYFVGFAMFLLLARMLVAPGFVLASCSWCCLGPCLPDESFGARGAADLDCHLSRAKFFHRTCEYAIFYARLRTSARHRRRFGRQFCNLGFSLHLDEQTAIWRIFLQRQFRALHVV